MEVFDVVRTVLAVREFADKPLPPGLLDRIVDAGRLTGSSKNGQPWHFVVVESREELQSLGNLARTGPYIAHAAAAVVVLVDQSIYAISDGSRAIQSMILAAWSEGVGSNWVGFGSMPEVNKLLGIPDSLDVLGILPFGYAAKSIGQGKKRRKDRSEVVSYGHFGQKDRS